MFGSVVEEEADATSSQLAGLLDRLHNLELSALSNENLLTLTRDLETHKRRLSALDHPRHRRSRLPRAGR